jgi:hypothetical protein
MKRYLLFTFGTYYPSGGWRDFAASFDTIEAAMGQESVQVCDHYQNYQIVDSATGELVKQG